MAISAFSACKLSPMILHPVVVEQMLVRRIAHSHIRSHRAVFHRPGGVFLGAQRVVRTFPRVPQALFADVELTIFRLRGLCNLEPDSDLLYPYVQKRVCSVLAGTQDGDQKRPIGSRIQPLGWLQRPEQQQDSSQPAA